MPNDSESFPQLPCRHEPTFQARCIEPDAGASCDSASRRMQADRVNGCIDPDARMHRARCVRIEDNDIAIPNEYSPDQSADRDPPSQGRRYKVNADRTSFACIVSNTPGCTIHRVATQLTVHSSFVITSMRLRVSEWKLEFVSLECVRIKQSSNPRPE